MLDRQALKDRIKGMIALGSHRLERSHEPISITELVSPLRYDILVRRDFIEFLGEHVDLYREDREGFMLLSARQPYFEWFVRVYCVTLERRLLLDPGRLFRAYCERVERTLLLRSQFLMHGFDDRYPLILNAGREILPTDTGKLVVRDFYAGDGCHRIALLLYHGVTVLAPDQYRVRVHRRYRPRDNTYRLRHLLDAQQYCRFLSGAYCRERCESYGDLLSAAQRQNPGRARELQSVLAIDAVDPARHPVKHVTPLP